MKILTTSKFDPYAYKPLNDLILKNRYEYCKFNNYNVYFENTPLDKTIDKSWRQAQIILSALKNKEFKKYDFIINTGQRNIVTNFNIKLEDKIKLRMNDDINMIYQYWQTNQTLYPIIFRSENNGGKIKAKLIKRPYIQLATE